MRAHFFEYNPPLSPIRYSAFGDIERIAQELTARGFFPVQGLDHFRSTTKDECAIPPRPRDGAELGFVFQKDDLAVVVWTTWLLSRGDAREDDCGWVLIEQGNEGIYFIPVHRTKHFVERLLMEAKIARCRVRNRPICLRCGERMSISRGNGLGSRYWRCTRCRASNEWDTDAFLTVLPAEAKQHLARRRNRRERWYDACRKNGKPIRQAMLRRKPWRKAKLPISGF